MRLHIKTTPNDELIWFNYQPKLTGTIHKWIGKNELHGSPALYSFSWLMNAKAEENGLNFPNGAKLFISFYDDKYLKQIVDSIIKNPSMFFGMKATDVVIEEDSDFINKTSFMCASPIFIQRFEGRQNIHYTFEDENAGELLTETLLHKMKLAGLPKDETLKISFDTSAPNKKTRIIDYNGIKNRVSQCPVLIEGKPETKLFAWKVGLGNSTGIGFGAIY